MTSTRLILAVFFVVMLLSCIKKEVELPPEEAPVTTTIKSGIETTEIHGFFLASLGYYNSNTDLYSARLIFACFNDPAKRLMLTFDRRHNTITSLVRPNVSVGNVSFSGHPLQELQGGNTVSYLGHSNIMQIPDDPQWKIQGNATFAARVQVVERRFPYLLLPGHQLRVNPLKGFTFRFKGMFENCDSVGIEINNYPEKVYKVAARSADSITFFPGELAFMKNQEEVAVFIWVTNLSSQTVDNKKFVYELMIREQKVLVVDTLL
jgi:hypothetical protein